MVWFSFGMLTGLVSVLVALAVLAGVAAAPAPYIQSGNTQLMVFFMSAVSTTFTTPAVVWLVNGWLKPVGDDVLVLCYGAYFTVALLGMIVAYLVDTLPKRKQRLEEAQKVDA